MVTASSNWSRTSFGALSRATAFQRFMVLSIRFAASFAAAVLTWKGAADLSSIAGKPVRLQFKLVGAVQLYSFWVSNSTCGESQGYVAAGGKGFDGMKDTKGQC